MRLVNCDSEFAERLHALAGCYLLQAELLERICGHMSTHHDGGLSIFIAHQVWTGIPPKVRKLSWRAWGGADFNISFVDPERASADMVPEQHVCTPVSHQPHCTT